MHSYELYFIVYPEADEEELTDIIDRVTQTIPQLPKPQVCQNRYFVL